MKITIAIFVALFFMPAVFFAYAERGIEVDIGNAKLFRGDTIKLVGHTYYGDAGTPVYIDVSIVKGAKIAAFVTETDENGDFKIDIDTSQSPWKFYVHYEIIARIENPVQPYGYVDFSLDPNSEDRATLDFTRPVVIVPKTITVDSKVPAVVTFTVKAIDDRDGVINPVCTPKSNSIFPLGKTNVDCVAIDSSGNQKTEGFVVIVKDRTLSIPVWLKDVASLWVSSEIDDDGFVQVIQYLIENNAITVPADSAEAGGAVQVPSWIKTNAGFWVDGQISDAEFAAGIGYLINKGIIRV